MGQSVSIYEVGPRDGLQNEAALITTDDKIALVNRLVKAGLKQVEVSSFVSPKWVPQLADAADVFSGIQRSPDVVYAALTPNVKGLERALAADVNEVAIFAAASEAFSQKNINCSIDESLKRFKPMMQIAADAKVRVRGYISCMSDCPYSGNVEPGQVANLAEALLELGCYSISLGDTLGKATPSTTKSALNAVLSVANAEQLAGHFHDTTGHAIANIAVCMEAGLRVFDTAIGGLGGCPYAPGAKGNVSTESVVKFMESQGMHTGIDAAQLDEIGQFARSLRIANN